MSRENQQQQLRKQIAELENQIYDMEGIYLQNTKETGNLIKGFDNYLNTRIPKNQSNKKPKIQNVERLFSLTSVRSKTSEALSEGLVSERNDFIIKIAPRIRNKNNKGKTYSREQGESAENNSGSADDPSMDQFSNNKGARRKSRKN